MILLRYMMAKSRSIMLQSAEEILQAMPTTIKTIHIVFVISKDCAQEYANGQDIPDSVTLGRGRKI